MRGVAGGEGRWWSELGNWDGHIYTTMYKTHNIQHRKFYSVLCGDLNGKKILKWGDMYIHIAGSLYSTAETNILKHLYSNKNFKISFRFCIAREDINKTKSLQVGRKYLQMIRPARD